MSDYFRRCPAPRTLRISQTSLLLLGLAGPACDGDAQRSTPPYHGAGPAPAVVPPGSTAERPAPAVTDGARSTPARLAAVDALRRGLGISDPVGAVGKTAPPFLSDFDSTGAVSGVWAFRKGGLGAVARRAEGASPTRDQLDAAFRSFVQRNTGLYDLEGDDATGEGMRRWLVGPELLEYQPPEGKPVQKLTYQQVVDGVPVLGGDVVAMFSDGVLTSVNGAIENPASVRRAARPTLGPRRAEAAAAAHNKDRFTVDYRAAGTELLWDHKTARFVYRVKAAPVELNGLTQIVDGETGKVLGESSHLVGKLGPTPSLPWVPRNYTISKPDPADFHPFIVHDTTQEWSGLTEIGPSGLRVYYHGDQGNNVSHPTYGYYYTGPEAYTMDPGNKTYFQTPFDFNQAYAPGRTSGFASQHTVRWTQHAAQIAARTTFRGLYAPSKQNQVLNVITGIPGGASYTYSDCSAFGLSGMDCIAIAPGTQPFVGRGDVSTLGPIFHEYGHVADARILNGSRFASGCEAQSLGETIAEMWAMMAFMWTYGTTATFTDYDGHGAVGQPASVQGFINGLGMAGQRAVVHTNNSNIACFDTRVANCGPDVYTWGTGLAQAYWEAAHGVNCGGTSCVTLNDGSMEAHAGNALAYAMSATPGNQGFVPFVANFLAYYFNNVGNVAWNNRWWIFNHHRLVGPNFGYSPCHAW